MKFKKILELSKKCRKVSKVSKSTKKSTCYSENEVSIGLKKAKGEEKEEEENKLFMALRRKLKTVD